MAEKERGALKEEKKKEGVGGKRNLRVKEIGGKKFHCCELINEVWKMGQGELAGSSRVSFLACQ